MDINDEVVEKVCVYCGEVIDSGAGRCRYCGSHQKKSESRSESKSKSYGNSLKVFLTVLYTIIPCLGQIAGVIHGIALINSENNDKRSFGRALLTSMVAVFFLMCVITYVLAVMLITIIYY